MSKPLGIGLEITEQGPRMYVNQMSRVADLIWEAVRESIWVGVSPKQFKQEVAQAWEHEMKEQIKRAKKILE